MNIQTRTGSSRIRGYQTAFLLPLLVLGGSLLRTTQASAAESALEISTVSSVESEPVITDAVEHAIREYVLAKYRGDDEGVRARAHHDIARRVVMNTYWGEASDEWVRCYSHDQLQFYGTAFNETKRDDPENGRCEIEVFNIEQRTAAARVVMEDVVDFMHLVLFDGRWVIADSSVIILPEPGAVPPEITTDDQRKIERVIRDYCIGFYEINGKKVQRTCHPSLSKRTVEHIDGTDFNFFKLITWEEIELLGEVFNKHWGFDPQTARCEVEVYEIRDNVAIAKLTGTVWFDYFQLMRVNGDWKIVNIMFESLPEERWSDVQRDS